MISLLMTLEISADFLVLGLLSSEWSIQMARESYAPAVARSDCFEEITIFELQI